MCLGCRDDCIGKDAALDSQPDHMRHSSRWAKVLAFFFLWSASRAVYFVYLGNADTDYRLAAEAGFGPAVWIGQTLYAVLATGAMTAIWLRHRGAFPLSLAALAIYGSLTVFQLWQVERDPERAKEMYAASRVARGLPAPDDRLELLFSPIGRRFAWAIGGLVVLTPLALLLWRRRDFEPAIDD